MFGAKKDEKTGMPHVTQGYVVNRADGTVLTASEPSTINPTSLGQVTRMFGFRLTDTPPGDYEIVMAVRDDVAGRSFDLREPFKVGEPLPASAMPPSQPAGTQAPPPPAEPAGAPAPPPAEPPGTAPSPGTMTPPPGTPAPPAGTPAPPPVS